MVRGATIRAEHPNGFDLVRKLITREHRLRFEQPLCLGCDLCTAICPQQAIKLQPGSVTGGRLTVRPAIAIDPARCSFCGECVILCPTHALRLEVDRQARVPALEMGVFPRLAQQVQIDLAACRPGCDLACQSACPREAIAIRTAPSKNRHGPAVLDVLIDEERCTYCTRCHVACPQGAVVVRKPWRGHIHLATEHCPVGCQACADLCPNRALYVQDGRVALDEPSCTYCGACRRVCPAEGALTVQRSGVQHTPIRSGAWYEALEKLVSPLALAIELDAAAQARRRQAATYLPGSPRE